MNHSRLKTYRQYIAWLLATLFTLGILQPPGETRALAYSVRPQVSPQVDLLIIHGNVVDGKGKKPGKADVGIRGDRIVFIGNADKAHLTATRRIDATGMMVAPGFIDPHTHTLGDLTNEQTKSNQAYLMQGVTT